jgi:hypothetical protein
MYGVMIIWIEFILSLTWFAAPDSNLWKELKEGVGCTYLVKKKRDKVKSIKK